MMKNISIKYYMNLGGARGVMVIVVRIGRD